MIAVYNAVRYLEFIFAALQRQSVMDFEVIVADDGSGPEIAELINTIRALVPFPINHVWQSDVGFRKNAMLNKAVNASQSDYLIFIDGDCLPHHAFVRDHLENRRQYGVLCGRRVNFSKQITERLDLEKIRSGQYERLSFNLLLDGLLARSSNLEDAIRLENTLIRRMLHWNRARILGCNFSLEKKLLEKINGFNEEYQAPGLGEDSDIAYRLELVGARLITLRYLAVLYHLYHPVIPIGEENKRIYERMVSAQEVVCRHGLQKLE